MMKLDEYAFEMAECNIERMRSAGIKKAQIALAKEGEERCVDCGKKIDPNRRIALPSAIRCTRCQAKWEQKCR